MTDALIRLQTVRKVATNTIHIMNLLMRHFRGGSLASLRTRSHRSHILLVRAEKASKADKASIESDDPKLSVEDEGVVGEGVKKARKPRKAKAPSEEASELAQEASEAPLMEAPEVTPKVAKKSTKAARSMGIKTPWGLDIAVEEQQAELELYQATRPKTTEERRGRKKKVPLTPATAEAVEINAEMEAKLVIRDEEGNPTVDRTALGEGKMETWAVGCFVGKEKKYIEAVEGFLKSAAPLIDKETGQVIPRVVDFSLPTKKIKAFNEKTIKWSDKTIKYKDGGWVFVQGILDKDLFGILSSTLFFQYFRNTLKIKFAFEDDVVEVPVPCTASELEEVKAWKLHKDEEAAELEKCEQYGGTVDVEIASQVVRRDEMEEDTDVDEFGNKVYKNDYTGSFANPNNFYEPDLAPPADKTKSKAVAKRADSIDIKRASDRKKEVIKNAIEKKVQPGTSSKDGGWYAPPVPHPSAKSLDGKGDMDEPLFGDWTNDDLFKGLDDDLFGSVGRKGFQDGKDDDFDLGLGDGFDDFFDDDEDPFGLGRFDSLPSSQRGGQGMAQSGQKSKGKGSFAPQGSRDSRQSWMQPKGDRDDWGGDKWDTLDDLGFEDGPEDDLFAPEGPGAWGGDEIDDLDFDGSSKGPPPKAPSRPPPEGRRGYGSSPPQRDGAGGHRGYQGGQGGWSGHDRGAPRQDWEREREYGRPRYEDERTPSREGREMQGQGDKGAARVNPNYQGGQGGGRGAGAGRGSTGRGPRQYDRPSSFDEFSSEDTGGYMQKTPRRDDGDDEAGFWEDDNPSDRGGGGGRYGGRGGRGGRGYEGGRGRGGRGRW